MVGLSPWAYICPNCRGREVYVSNIYAPSSEGPRHRCGKCGARW